MAKLALNFAVKLALFCGVMLLVAQWVPYDGLVDRFISKHFDFEEAERLTRFVLGEPDLEVWESLRDYFCVIVNTAISIPLFGLIITGYRALTMRGAVAPHAKEWMTSTVKRFLKVISFTFLFWAVLRIFPYEAIIKKDSNSNFVFSMIILFNLIVSISTYIVVVKLLRKTRSK